LKKIFFGKQDFQEKNSKENKIWKLRSKRK